MIKTVVLPALLAIGMGVGLWAQSDEDYKGWMKDIGATNSKIRKGVAAKQMDGVATDATHLAEIYGSLAKFWETRKADDAVTVAKTGESAAKAIADAAKAGDEAKVQSSMMTIGGTCNGCHMAHRAGSPGNFTIK
jgi:hypothetical protein